jgi:hypothetical protein
MPLNLAFLMRRMTSATWAKLLDRELVGLALLILGGRVITTLTPVALKSYQVSHVFFLG